MKNSFVVGHGIRPEGAEAPAWGIALWIW